MNDPQGTSWEASEDADAAAVQTFNESFEDISFEDFGGPIVGTDRCKQIADPELRHAYASALFDVCELRDEIRLQGGLGALLVNDFNESVTLGTASPPEMSTATAGGLPIDIAAVYRTYAAPIAQPFSMRRSPHEHMSMHRIKSLSLAGQMFDNCLFRAMAALDRIAIMLWAAADRPMPKRYPAFRPNELSLLAAAYDQHETWAPLVTLAGSDYVGDVNRMRQAFTHSWRRRSALHGSIPVTALSDSDGATEDDEFLNVQKHFDAVFHGYNAIRVSTTFARELISHARSIDLETQRST